MLRIFFSAIIALSVMPACAGPDINVGELHEYIQPTQNTLAKRINNSGDATAFVRVSVEEMVFSGKTYSEKKQDFDALINGIGTGLISSPARLIIPVKSMQVNRLVVIGDRSQERYYRVRYIPVIPDDSQEFGLNKEESEKYNNDINAGLTVLTGFGTVVTVLPSAAHFDTKISNTNGRLHIRNQGNASIVIRSLTECDKDLVNCSSVTHHQLRPGMDLERPVSSGKVWQYTLREGTKETHLTSGNTNL
ncbi:hypothetical protein EC835_11812 [Providencia alcalifaciens]|uniref:Pilus assembly protein n=1 Tax=Providencia alcalifaciens TaxID=126385 RepID=A0A4R3NEM3_9GAMM|nr:MULTISPECIES: hypothetical protein [Providencia]MBC5792359.1 hypothetical protein [Providencia sp. JUb39]TCT28195.1 hypothetical protein EC835_11812 [Providencia alcalifaciens]